MVEHTIGRIEDVLAAAAAHNLVVGSAASGSETPTVRAQADVAPRHERTELNAASPELTSMEVSRVDQHGGLNATPPVWTGKSPAYVCRDLVRRKLAHLYNTRR